MEWIPLFSRCLNTVMLLVLAVGLAKRRRAKVHMTCMLTAFAGDLLNVLVIEVYARTRGTGAVEQGVELLTAGGHRIQEVHILVSVLCLVGYFIAVITGTRLYRKGRGRRFHKINAALFIVTRLASYVTSFWMGS